MHELPADLVFQLLKDARLTESEVSDRLRKLADASYWRQLAPALHIGSDLPRREEAAAASNIVAAAALRDEGVFHLRGAVTPDLVEQLNDGIDFVVAAGWPPVFAFVYDESWRCGRSGGLVRLVTDVLGADAAQIPHVWTHIVPAADCAAGWRPHVDGAPGSRRLSCWVASSDATLDNGCMHRIPRLLSPPHFASRLDEGTSFTSAEMTAALHSATALPAAAGDVLGWTFDVVHWGGRARAGRSERRSLSFEYIASSETPYEDERPTLPLTDGLPPLDRKS